MKRKIVILLCLPSLSVFSGCGTVFESGYIDKGPPSAGEWYQKPGATVKEIHEANEKCKKLYPDDRRSNIKDRTNNHFKERFCMEDQGYLPNDGNRAINSCKNFVNPQIPICEARGAY